MPKLQNVATFLDTKKAGLSKNGLIITLPFLIWELWLSLSSHFFPLFQPFTYLSFYLKSASKQGLEIAIKS